MESGDENESHDHASYVAKETIQKPGDTGSNTKEQGDVPQSDPTISAKKNKGRDDENEQRPEQTIQKPGDTGSNTKEQGDVPQSDLKNTKIVGMGRDDVKKQRPEETIQKPGDTGSNTKEQGDVPQSDPTISAKDDKERDNENEHRPEQTIQKPGDTGSNTKEQGDIPQSDLKNTKIVGMGRDDGKKQRPEELPKDTKQGTHTHEQKDLQTAQEVKQEITEFIKTESEDHQDSSHERLFRPIETAKQEKTWYDEEEDEQDDTQDDMQEDTLDDIQDDIESNKKRQEMFWRILIALGVVCVVFAVVYQLPYSTPPVQKNDDVVDIFIQKMANIKSSFPNQHPELWKRSQIHISRHLKTVNPTEPVSLILTSGRGAKRTLNCLAQSLAKAFSSALNSSFLEINGESKASQDSDQVKLDIDSELRKAFGGKQPAAVIHRFEELPPGSTLIFYRYCDHETAAYKKVFLVFTVMLDAFVEVPSNASLARVEDMVYEQIKRKFVSSDKSAVFNQMDVDKLSGLWSRISHLILPVVGVEKIEEQGCGSEGESF